MVDAGTGLRSAGWLRRNWFVPVALASVAIEIGFTRSTDWSQPRLAEAAVLFDLCLFVPALFLVCYRHGRSAKALALRFVALACLGFYIASWLVPAAAQQLIVDLGWLRIAGMVVLALIELRLLVAAVRMVFRGNVQPEQLAERTGAPLWIARLMALEARFWKAVWRLVRGRRD